jgi:hypothetical protein
MSKEFPGFQPPGKTAPFRESRKRDVRSNAEKLCSLLPFYSIIRQLLTAGYLVLGEISVMATEDRTSYAKYSFADVFAMNQFATHKQEICKRAIKLFKSRPDIYSATDIERYKDHERHYADVIYWTDEEMDLRLEEHQQAVERDTEVIAE